MTLPRFIAAHTLPFTEAQLKDLTKETLPAGVTWKLTYCDFDANKFFCDWDAPSKDVIAEEFKRLNIPFDAIYPVKIFNPAKADFE
jgi:hypothetical protein